MAKFTTQQLAEFKKVKPALTKQFKKVLKSLPPATATFWNNDRKLLELNNFKYDLKDLQNLLKEVQRVYMDLYIEASNATWEKGKLSEKQRGWHKDHYNYNKAEKHELPPSLRRTPARNVTKTGAKRKRATTVKKYKR